MWDSQVMQSCYPLMIHAHMPELPPSLLFLSGDVGCWFPLLQGTMKPSGSVLGTLLPSSSFLSSLYDLGCKDQT